MRLALYDGLECQGALEGRLTVLAGVPDAIGIGHQRRFEIRDGGVPLFGGQLLFSLVEGIIAGARKPPMDIQESGKAVTTVMSGEHMSGASFNFLPRSFHCLSVAFDDLLKLVGCKSGEDFLHAGWPAHFNLIDL